MTFRSLLYGIAAVPLALAVPAHALDSTGAGRHMVPLPAPVNALSEAEIQVAQVSDPRVVALEEQVRQLNGTIEELNFQILQMQEQLRKMQEDNEFRFQELEGKRSGAAAPDADATANSVSPPQTGTIPDVAAAAPPPGETEGAADRGEPPRTFGTITFDEKGNATGAGVAPAADPQIAALPDTANPEELYRNSYEFILSGDYKTAEAGFRDHIERYPNDPRAADAHFWLGESLLGQNRHRDAAEVFLAANRDYPQSPKAPDMLLKLGISLAAMNQRDIACATFGEIGQRYPQVSGALKDRVSQERALAGC